MTPQLDLTDTPVLDGHCFTFQASPLTREELNRRFWLGGVELESMAQGAYPKGATSYLEHSVAFREYVGALSAFLGCDPTPDAVVSARAARMADYEGYVKALVDDANIKLLMVDNATQTMEEVDQFGAGYPGAVHKTFRIETLVRDLLGAVTSFDSLVADFDSAIDGAVRDHGCAAFKAVIAYRTGLDIRKVDEQEARRDFDARAERTEWFGPYVKQVRDFLMRRALIRSIDLRAPVLIHTGLGDTDIVAAACNPALLSGLLLDEEVLPARVVLVHGGWPYTEEAGWLANVLPNVYLELSADQPPFMQPSVSVHRYAKLLRMVPIPKLIYGSDGQDLPEPHWYNAKYAKRVMGRALSELVDEGVYTADEAMMEAENLFFDNGKALFGV